MNAPKCFKLRIEETDDIYNKFSLIFYSILDLHEDQYISIGLPALRKLKNDLNSIDGDKHWSLCFRRFMYTNTPRTRKEQFYALAKIVGPVVIKPH